MAAETSMTKGVGMKQMVGSPGTWSGMALRVSQCAFAAASVCAMVTAFDCWNNPAFWYFRFSCGENSLNIQDCLGLYCDFSSAIKPYSAFDCLNNPAFKYFRFMSITMLLQIVWSLGLACFDIYAIRNRKDLHERAPVFVLVVGDGIMMYLTYAAASAAAGTSTLIVGDVRFCRWAACGQIVLSIVLAFIAWLLEATSAYSMLRLHPSFS